MSGGIETGTKTGLLHSLSSELADIVERVAPSVVRVNDGSRLTATGLIWSEDGLIVTTSHGVERDEDLTIERADGTTLPAVLVGRDPDTDVALLRVQATGLPAITPGDETQARVGHLVLALGRPGSAGLQATLGIISARLESQHGGQPEFILNTDAVLYPGFSGGALVNTAGQVVGLTNLAFGRGQGVALGIPVVANVVQALLAHGRVQRGYLGVRAQAVILPETLRASLKLEQTRGLLVVQAEPGGPAEQGGLLLGDTLLTLAGHSVEDVDDLRRQLRGYAAGQTIALGLARGGEWRDLSVTLGSEA